MSADPYLPRLIVEQVLFADEAAIERFAREFAGPNLEAISDLVQSGIEAGEETSRTQTSALTDEFIHISKDMPHHRKITLNTGSMILKEIPMKSAERWVSELL